MKRYPNLETEISRRGIKKNKIAETLNITPRSLSSKLSGVFPFKWEEARDIHETFFKDLDIGELFYLNDSSDLQRKE